MKFPTFHWPDFHWLAFFHWPASFKLPAMTSLPDIPFTFLWPQFLWLLLLVPLAVAVYFLLLRRRKKAAVRYGNFGMVKLAVTSGSRFRRHIPPLLFLVAFTIMILGVSRPAAVISLTSEQATVILAMDVSGSMRAEDIKPSRIKAAQTAAKTYISQQPRGVRIGIVAFAGTALLVQPPTIDRQSLDTAIDRFQLQRSTAVGSGILVALSTLFPHDNFAINRWNNGFNPDYGGFGYPGTPLGGTPSAGNRKKHIPVAPGSYKSAVIILLTDGATTSGPDPVEAAHQAADYGVRVYTVGFGTTAGDVVGFAGMHMRAQLDETALKKIADLTQGRYFRAGSAADLQAVYKVLGKNLVTETRQTEITAFFAAAAAFFALLSAGLSLLWFSRIF